MLAFLLGNQGPDPFFMRFSTLPGRVASCHRLAGAWHATHVSEALFAIRAAAADLPDADRDLGQAFALGILGHYVLDSHVHPFVRAQQRSIMEAEPALASAEREVHALIEAELDAWLLWSLRGQTVVDAPMHADLARTRRIARVGGELFEYVAREVFGLRVGAADYEGSLRDYELVLRLINPPHQGMARLIGAGERLLFRWSYLLSMAPPVQADDRCAAANLERRPWVSEVTGEPTTASFAGLYYGALDAWPSFVEAFHAGDQARFEQLAAGVTYDGTLACTNALIVD